MRRVLWLCLCVCAGPRGAEATSLALDAPPSLAPALTTELSREAPDVTVVPKTQAAELAVRVYAKDTDLWLEVRVKGRLLQTRRLGHAARPDLAIRRALLILTETLDTLETPETPDIPSVAAATPAQKPPPPASRPPPLPPSPPESSTTDTLPAAGTTTATVAPPSMPSAPPRTNPAATTAPRASTTTSTAGWVLEGGAASVTWSGPFSLRLGLTAAGFYRIDRWQFGLRASVTGLCCRVTRDNVRVDALTTVAVLEVHVPLILGAVSLSAIGAGGVQVERVTAEITDLFAGPAAPESQFRTDALGRLGVRVGFPPDASWRGWTQLGVEVHGRALSINLPEPYRDGRQSPSQSRWRGFWDIGVAFDIF